MIKLSPRLLSLAQHVERGNRVADIGTDHAYLPIYLMQQGIAERVIGSDINEGPYLAAQKAVSEADLTGQIALRKGNGLETIDPGEVNVVVIAGMGGGTMMEILEGRSDVVEQLERLILQPMINAAQLRQWLNTHGWQIIYEDLVEDDHRIYEIIVAEPGTEDISEEIIYELGPRLLEREHPLYHRHLERMVAGEEKILRQLARSQQPEARVKAAEISQKIQRMKEVVWCQLQLRI